MRIHLTFHYFLSFSGAVDYICAECGKTFLSSSSLAQHKTVHSDLRPFKCDRCDKTFKKQSTLQQHYTCHTGEGRHHYCETCGKSFLQPGQLGKVENSVGTIVGTNVGMDVWTNVGTNVGTNVVTNVGNIC